MKTKLTLFVLLFLCIVNVDAQNYSINKLNYDVHQYRYMPGDPYNPAISGICSYFLPGLGQMVNGETGRGLAFLGGSTACMVICCAGIALDAEADCYGLEGRPSRPTRRLSQAMIISGFLGMVYVNIWSIVDAVKVAKVNNMYYQDQRKTTIGLELKPYTETISMSDQTIRPIGLTLKVSL